MIRTLRLAVAAAAALAASAASASHFRGATLIPEIDANGLLTVNAVSFWRKNSGGQIGSITVSGPGGNVADSFVSITSDDAVTDSRRLEVREVFSAQLSQAGTYTIDMGSCCWVGGVPNTSGEVSFATQSVIVWDGSTATKPITFDLTNIQQEVSRNSAYSDNLGVTGPGPFTYTTDLSLGMTAQPAGFAIDSNGTITMPLSTTSAIVDNSSNTGSGINVGADLAFSGTIQSNDGSSAQFVWVFDGTDSVGQNNAPNVADVVINAVIGDNISTLIGATDPDADPVSLLLASFNGPGGAVGNATFGDNGDNTGTFGWDSTGFAAGTYIAAIQGSDGSLTDNGQITINLRAPTTTPPVGAVPLPAAGLLALSGFAALGGLGWRRRRG